MVEAPIPVNPAEGVGAEAVPLGLKEVQRACGVAQPVVVAQAGGEGGDGHAALGGGGYHIPPVRLILGQDRREIAGKQQVFQGGTGAVGLRQPVQEGGADDAASTEEQGDAPRSRSQW